MSKSKVTVVILNNDRQDLLSRSIDSVLEQEYREWELIVVELAPASQAAEVTSEYITACVAGYPANLIRHIRNEENEPIWEAQALNIGIKQAKGEFITRIKSGDYIHPRKLEEQVRILELEPEVGMIYVRAAGVDEVGNREGKSRFTECRNAKDHLVGLVRGNFIHPGAELVRRSVFEKIGYYIEAHERYPELRQFPEYGMWLRVASHYTVRPLDKKYLMTRHETGEITYRKSGLDAELENLGLSLWAQEYDIMTLRENLDLTMGEAVELETEIRARLSAGGRWWQVQQRQEQGMQLEPEQETAIREQAMNVVDAGYFVKNAELYWLQGNHEMAAAQLRRVLELKDSVWEHRAKYMLASHEKKNKNYMVAMELFRQVAQQGPVKNSPYRTGALFHLGELYEEKGDEEKATACYRECLNERPGHGQAALNLNRLQKNGNKTVHQKDHWDAGAEENPIRVIADLENRQEFEISGVADANMILKHLGTRTVGTVLDVGCGIGRVMKPMSYAAEKIVGVDTSKQMIEKGRYYLKNIENAELHHIETGTVPYESETFDQVYSIIVFMHLPRRKFEAWVKEIHRLLKPDGIFWFQAYGDFGPGAVLNQNNEKIGGVRAYTREDLEEITGGYFEDIEIFRDRTDRGAGTHWHYAVCRNPVGKR